MIPLKKLAKLIMLGTALSNLAFVHPVQNDLIELKEGLNLRSSAHFRDSQDDHNKIAIVPANAKGIIQQVKAFDSGNFGLCVEFIKDHQLRINLKESCYWVYLSKSKPAIKLYNVAHQQSQREQVLKDWQGSQAPAELRVVQTPRPMQIAQTLREVSALPASSVPAAPAPGKKEIILIGQRPSHGADHGLSSSTVKTIIALNQNSSPMMQPQESCTDCQRPRLVTGEVCSSQNSYQNSMIDQLLRRGPHADFFSSPQKEIITTACVQRNMLNFSKSSAYFRSCSSGQQQGGKAVPRPCVDSDYVEATAKAFNLSAECLGDYVAGYSNRDLPQFRKSVENPVTQMSQSVIRSAKQQSALSIFSFMSQESGMHINAQSSRGSGGPGQMTGGAIESVNNDLKNIRTHLAEKTDQPQCSKTLLKALSKPLTTIAKACDRKNPENLLQAMAYAFAYQAFVRRHLENTVFDKNMFGRLISSDLPVTEKDRFMMEVTAWAHNTGQGGMQKPLAALMTHWAQNGRKIRTSTDIDQFLSELGPYVGKFNPGRGSEPVTYYRKIQEQMKNIAPGGRQACLAI